LEWCRLLSRATGLLKEIETRPDRKPLCTCIPGQQIGIGFNPRGERRNPTDRDASRLPNSITVQPDHEDQREVRQAARFHRVSPPSAMACRKCDDLMRHHARESVRSRPSDQAELRRKTARQRECQMNVSGIIPFMVRGTGSKSNSQTQAVEKLGAPRTLKRLLAARSTVARVPCHRPRYTPLKERSSRP